MMGCKTGLFVLPSIATFLVGFCHLQFEFKIIVKWSMYILYRQTGAVEVDVQLHTHFWAPSLKNEQSLIKNL